VTPDRRHDCSPGPAGSRAVTRAPMRCRHPSDANGWWTRPSGRAAHGRGPR
jgi:hypothetical protein